MISGVQKVLIAIGTRPEIIKMAPIYHEFKKNNIETLLLHTGQHLDMADSLYEFSGIVPDFRIELERPGQAETQKEDFCGLSMLGYLLLKKISDVFANIDNLSAVLVHGDTSSALMAALAAYYKKCPIAHIEAGLRTHNMYSPFPEEKNRKLIAQLAHWHFAPTELARQNLLREGIPDANIYVVGNTIVEAAQLGIQRSDDHVLAAQNDPAELTSKLGVHVANGKKMILVTVHRHENQSGNIQNIAQAVLQLVQDNPDFVVIWPVHPNPRVKSVVLKEFSDIPGDIDARIYLTQPLSYPILLWILKNSWLVLTDSGGIQEEAAALGSPVMVLRDTTERSEIIESGTGLLIGTNKEDIMNQVSALKQNPAQYEKMQKAKNPFGDGKTAQKICQILKRDLSATAAKVCLAVMIASGVVTSAEAKQKTYENNPSHVLGQLIVAQGPTPTVVATTAAPQYQTTTTTSTTSTTTQYLRDKQQQPLPPASRVVLTPPPPKQPLANTPATLQPVTTQSPAQSQDGGAFATSPATPIDKTGYLEAGGLFHNVSNGFGNWSGAYIKGEFRTDEKNLWLAEADFLHEFKDEGVYATIGNTHIFNNDWYSSVAVGGSIDGFFLPVYRIDAAINRKWFEERRFVTTLGVGVSGDRDDHNDYGLLLGAAYYFEEPWIVQAGVRFNISSPGSVNSESQYIAVTQGRVKEHFITLRYSFGNEAYQVVGPGRTISDFNSQVVSLEARQWIGDDWGVNALGEFYHNPNYDRTGIRFGIFKDF